MINAIDVALSYGKRIIFQDVNIKFTPGNCYGLIGANGAGKSTFLKILAGEIEPDRGTVSIGARQRMTMLRQDHFAFDEITVLNTVIMGHARLYEIMAEREEIYAKTEFTDADGIRSGELESEFGEMNGYEAEPEAASLLAGLGIHEDLQQKKMKELEGGEKVRVLLAQALFGSPDILLLDEPTNNLDLDSMVWLENFLDRFTNTVIIVSHDRHFLNQVCTHMADIDFGKVTTYVGNYDFWYEASQLALQQKQNENKKTAAKAKELQDFIARFSSNASKAKQATSRKKLLDKMTIEDMPVSSRKYPFVHFKAGRSCGDTILTLDNVSKSVDGERLLHKINITVNKGDKIAFVGSTNSLAKSCLLEMLAGEIQPDEGVVKWGVTMSSSYFPKENSMFFDYEATLVEWLSRFTPPQEGESFARGFLGKMLFTGEEALKKTPVLSGGEKVRCMLARMMLSDANALILDEPTNHLDLESITALNNGLMEFPEIVFFTSHDHQFVSSIANRIIEILPKGVIDRVMDFDDYIIDESVIEERAQFS